MLCTVQGRQLPMLSVARLRESTICSGSTSTVTTWLAWISICTNWRVLHCTPRRMSPKVRTLTEAMRMPTEMSSTMPRKELQSGSVPDEGPRVLFWTMRRAAPSEKLRKAAICEGFCWPRNFCTRLTGTCRSRSSSPRA